MIPDLNSNDRQKKMKKNKLLFSLIFFCLLLLIWKQSLGIVSYLKQMGASEMTKYLEGAPQFVDNEKVDDERLNNNDDNENFCTHNLDRSSFLTFASSSTNKIWRNYVTEILNLSRHKDDPDYVWHDFTAMLLDFITPRLSNSVKNLPILHWDKVGHILDKVYKRYKYINMTNRTMHNDTEIPTPLNVLILGGSVTWGSNCDKSPKFRDVHNIKCNWIGRLTRMSNEFFGNDVIKIRSFALGGTNTKTGTKIIEYNLLNAPEPFDIIINAYSTNDMHVLSLRMAEKLGITLQKAVMLDGEQFIRTALGNKNRCRGRHLPLLIFYNDYMGNEQNEITEINAYSSSMNQLASHYGISQISFADIVRHTLLGDTDETWFSPNLWPLRNVHPGRGFHTITPWVFAYNFLELATRYCDMKMTNSLPIKEDTTTLSNNESPYWTGYMRTPGIQLLQNTTLPKSNFPKIPRKPLPVPMFSIPPPLENSSLTDVSSKWRASEKEAIAAEQMECSDANTLASPCEFSFLAGLPGAVRPRVLHNTFFPHVRNNDGWKTVKNELTKPGISAIKANSKFEFILKVKEGNRTVNAITIFYMKSYGAGWDGSELHLQAFVTTPNNVTTPTEMSELILEATNDRNTSETFDQKLVLKKAAKSGDTVHAVFNLIRGTTFKIMGLLFCDH